MNRVLNQKVCFLTCVLFIGLALRLWGIGFGLPHLYHADEPIIVNHALAYGLGDLNPHFFKIPPLISYLLFITYGIYFVFGSLIGIFSGIDSFQNLFLSNPTSFYFIARILFGAGAGTLTILCIYRLGATFFSQTNGFIAALLLAVSFLHVRDSHFIYVDIPLLLIIVLALHEVLAIFKDNKTRHYYLFGFLWGCAIAVKYNGVFLVIPFLTALFLGSSGLSFMRDRRLYLVGVIGILTFGALNPYSWIDYKHFISELLTQAGAEGFTGIMYHIKHSLVGGLGVPILITSMLGVGILILQRNRGGWILISFCVSYYIVLILFSEHYDRYVLPLIPPLVVLSATAISYLSSRLNASRAIVIFITLLIASPSIGKSVAVCYLLSRPDIRTTASEWIEDNLADGSSVALDVKFFMPRIRHSLKQLERKRERVGSWGGARNVQEIRLEGMLKLARTESNKLYDLYYLSTAPEKPTFLFSEPAVAYNVSELRRLKIQYVVIARINQSVDEAFVTELEREGRLIRRFTPYRNADISWPLDPQPLTGAPFLWKDLISRTQNGHIIEIYEL